ncbi:MAG: DNA polymerase III subunit gamma/tau [Clostridia bacterium]|nr:DNA polymerase III subunit gamma/tau [Clostridia bacterium]
MQNTGHLALYRKWRPRTFDEVCGQDHITSVLKYETATCQLSHAYLFCGSRGTGKTSCAKILAKAVNCLSPVNGNPCGECAACRAIDTGATTDVLEMDAASNNGVDNIRDIRDEVNFAPSDLKYRVYIIDEVHMLSASAFNALLKTLEEPPAHVIFILATTELQKLPSTIISRCQRFDFRRISIDALISRLCHIANEENIKLHPEAAHLLARLAQGGMRDAISLLELCSGGGAEVTPERVSEAVGSVGRGEVMRTARAVAEADYDALFGIIAEAVASSKDLVVFWQELISLYRDMLIVKTTPDASRYLDLTDSEAQQLSAVTALFSRERLLAHCRLLDDALLSMQRSNAVKRTVAELTLIKMSDASLDISVESLLARIAKLEDMIRSGASFASQRTSTPAVSEMSELPVVSDDMLPEPPPASEDLALKSPQISETTVYEKPAPASDKASTPKKQTSAPNVRSGKRVLKSIGQWAEICARVARENQPVAALLAGTRAYIDGDDKIIVRFPNPFVQGMITNDSAKKDIVLNAIRAEISQNIRECDVLYEVKLVASNTPDDAIFDEIDAINNTDI